MTINAVNANLQRADDGSTSPLAPQGSAAQWFVDVNAANDNGTGAQGDPKKHIPSAFGLASPGDIIQVASGDYTAPENFFNENFMVGKTGTAQNWIIVRAETDGGVEIQQGFGTDGQTGPDLYYEFHGMKWNAQVAKALTCQYVKFFQCAFEGGALTGNNVNAGCTDWNLYEDCWFYGRGGRSCLTIFSKENVIVRGCTFRISGGWGFLGGNTNPEQIMTIYPNDPAVTDINIEVQNCIYIDADTYNPPAQESYYNAHFNSHPQASPPATNVFWRGCISLNNHPSGSAGFSMDGNGVMGEIQYENIVSIGNASGWSTQLNAVDPTLINKATIISNLNNGTVNSSGGSDPSLTDTIIAEQGSKGIGNNFNADFCNTFDNTDDANRGTNPIQTDPKLNGLLYPVRIEALSNLADGGKTNGVVGATIMKKIGVSGTLYLEPGYNTLTDIDLWPWANEDRIKADFASVLPVVMSTLGGSYTNFETGDVGKQLNSSLDGGDVGEILSYDNTAQTVDVQAPHGSLPTLISDGSVVTVISGSSGGGDAIGASVGRTFDGERGFCTGNSMDGNPQTLTKYIWEQFNNQIPPGIYP